MFQVLPPLVDVISEARLNLVIYYLRQDDVAEAYTLIKDLEPTVPQEYILKAGSNIFSKKIETWIFEICRFNFAIKIHLPI